MQIKIRFLIHEDYAINVKYVDCSRTNVVKWHLHHKNSTSGQAERKSARFRMCPNLNKRNIYISIGKHGEWGSIVRPQGARHSFLFWSKGAFLHFLFPLLSAKIWIRFDLCQIQQKQLAEGQHDTETVV